MKKILFLFISVILFLSSCKKDNSLHGTRLKTYTSEDYSVSITYNSFNKINKVEFSAFGIMIATKYCKYKADHSLYSLVLEANDGSYRYATDIECSNYRITKLIPYTLSYNSNGLLEKRENEDGSSTRFQIYTDSVQLYHKASPTATETLFSTIKLNNNIKNPFYIVGFEPEAQVIPFLLTFANIYPNTLCFPSADAELKNGSSTTTFTYEGNLNGYPLKRITNGKTETFTYEEF